MLDPDSKISSLQSLVVPDSAVLRGIKSPTHKANVMRNVEAYFLTQQKVANVVIEDHLPMGIQKENFGKDTPHVFLAKRVAIDLSLLGSLESIATAAKGICQESKDMGHTMSTAAAAAAEAQHEEPEVVLEAQITKLAEATLSKTIFEIKGPPLSLQSKVIQMRGVVPSSTGAAASSCVLMVDPPLDAPYTLLSEQNLGRPLEDIQLYMNVFSILPRELIPVSVSREILHHLCKELVLNYQVDIENLAPIGHQLQREIMEIPGINEEIKILQDEKINIETQCLRYLQSVDQEPLAAAFSFPYQKELDEVQAQLNRKSDESPENVQLAIAKRVADEVCKSRVSDLVASKVDSLPRFGELQKRSSQDNAARRMFMLNGGIASGKGTTQKKSKRRQLCRVLIG